MSHEEPEQNWFRRPLTWEEVRAIRQRFGDPYFTGVRQNILKSPNGTNCERVGREFKRYWKTVRKIVLNEIWREK